MIKKAANLFITAYLLIIFCVYPFYLRSGYLDIGEAKNEFFLFVSFAAVGIMSVCGFLLLVEKFFKKDPGREAYLINWDKVSATDLFVLLYATSVFMSFVFTQYREEALWGTEGWYIGFVFLILLCCLYFFISRMWDGNRKVFYALIVSSAVVFLLGICNRFSVYPIAFEVTQPDFISTLGNINWYCGFLAVVAPVGIGMFVFENKSAAVKKALSGFYAVITFMSGFAQGSSSIFLWFAALFSMLLWISLERREWIENWLSLLVLWGASAQLARLLRHILPGAYNYDLNNLCGYCTDSSFTLWIAFGGIIFQLVIRKWKMKEFDRNNIRKIRTVLLLLISALILAWVVMAILFTRRVIPLPEDKAVFRELFCLDENWGNGRGAAILAGFQTFKEMPFLHKLIGVGPDCFSKYAYSLPEVAEGLRSSFGGSRLTNVHNELFTALLNTGILGVSFYIGIFVSFVKGCMKKGKDNPVLYVLVTCIVCCFAHNMISFAQILNLPFLFILLGMGEAIRRKSLNNTFSG